MALVISAPPSVMAPLAEWEAHVAYLRQLLASTLDEDERAVCAFALGSATRVVDAKRAA